MYCIVVNLFITLQCQTGMITSDSVFDATKTIHSTLNLNIQHNGQTAKTKFYEKQLFIIPFPHSNAWRKSFRSRNE